MKFRKYTKKQQKTKTKQNKNDIKYTTSYVIFENLTVVTTNDPQCHELFATYIARICKKCGKIF
jgi:hypothetical protein